MSIALFWALVGLYIVAVAVSAFVGYGAGERGKDMPAACFYSSMAGVAAALIILILDVDFSERMALEKIILWAIGMLVAGSMSKWAFKAGYTQFQAKQTTL